MPTWTNALIVNVIYKHSKQIAGKSLHSQQAVGLYNIIIIFHNSTIAMPNTPLGFSFTDDDLVVSVG